MSGVAGVGSFKEAASVSVRDSYVQKEVRETAIREAAHAKMWQNDVRGLFQKPPSDLSRARGYSSSHCFDDGAEDSRVIPSALAGVLTPLVPSEGSSVSSMIDGRLRASTASFGSPVSAAPEYFPAVAYDKSMGTSSSKAPPLPLASVREDKSAGKPSIAYTPSHLGEGFSMEI